MILLNKLSCEFYVSIFHSQNSCASKHCYDTNICQFELPLTSLQTKITTNISLQLNALQNIEKQNSRIKQLHIGPKQNEIGNYI